MSIHHNGRGRSYALCDAKGCDANVIDLSLRVDEASRVVRTFFRWKQSAHNRHECPLHEKENQK